MSTNACDPEIITIAAKGGNFLYVVKEIESQLPGRGFLMRRLTGGETYQVLVGEPIDCSCTCLGFLRYGRCRHLFALIEKIATEKTEHGRRSQTVDV